MKNRLITMLIALLVSIGSAQAQESFAKYEFNPEKTYIIELQDGEQFVGHFLESNEQYIIIQTNSLPRIEIPIQKIISIEIVNPKNIKNGVYWFKNPNTTRYLFAPSAFTLKKGEGYYQNTYLALNSFNIGVTDHISIGGGVELFSTFGSLAAGKFQPVFFITPKIGYQVADKVNVGAGILYLSIPNDFGDSGRIGAGIVYGVGTYGTEEHNVSLGLGWGVADGEMTSKPVIVLSGMTRIGQKTALVSENWFIPTDPYYGVYSYGIRFFGEKLTVDLAFLNNADLAGALIIGIPYVDFVVKF